ncbi:MAG: succinate dehydrogenase assembly factor 2 [Ferrovum sp.]|nr:succinate dehydrogenase assembly factor 2 [Ferrovum sp.]NDU87499.1 succinate dehydrogenase assembly factor 2 [Ferrovum sp.]
MSDEDITSDPVLSRLLWRSRRGLLELDVLLHRFLTLHAASLTDQERQTYGAWLELSDSDLLRMVLEQVQADPRWAPLLSKILDS